MYIFSVCFEGKLRFIMLYEAEVAWAVNVRRVCSEHLGLHFSECVRHFSRAMDGLFSTPAHRNLSKSFYHNSFLFSFLLVAIANWIILGWSAIRKARMLLFPITFFRCHKQSLPEELSSCLNTQPEVLRTKPDVFKAGLLSSKSSQVGAGDLKILSEPKGSCVQPKTSTDEESRLESALQPVTGLPPRESFPAKASSKAEPDVAPTPELQKHLEHAASTSDDLSEKPGVKAGVSSLNSCVEKKIEPSSVGCQSQNLKETSVKVDNESCCTRSGNKTQTCKCFKIFLGKCYVSFPVNDSRNRFKEAML